MKGKNECRKEIWEFVPKDVTHFDKIEGEEIDECKQEGMSEAYSYLRHSVMFGVASSICSIGI